MSIEDIKGLETPNFKEIHDLYDKDDSVKAILFDIVESYIFESDKTKIMSFKENDNGQFLIELKGLIRFKIIDEVKSSKQYRECEVNFSDFYDDLNSKKENLQFSDLKLHAKFYLLLLVF